MVSSKVYESMLQYILSKDVGVLTELLAVAVINFSTYGVSPVSRLVFSPVAGMHIAMVNRSLITDLLQIVQHPALPSRVRQAALHAIANFSSFHDASKEVSYSIALL